jgi:hypothetical protein
MKFSTVTASAVLFGSMVIAMPANVVYETEVVTITSCAPEVTDCPYASKTVDTKPQTTTTPCSTSTPEVKYEPEYTTTEVKYEPEHTPCTTSTEVKYEPEHHTTPTPYPEPTYPVTTVHPEVKSTTPCPESTYTPPVTYPNTTTPVCPGGYGCEKPTYVPQCPGGYDCPPIPSGVPHPPANTSSPSYPTPPPVTNEGGANKLVGSLVAVMGVAVLALFA